MKPNSWLFGTRIVMAGCVAGLLACDPKTESPASDTAVATSPPSEPGTTAPAAGAPATSAAPSVGTARTCGGTTMSGRGVGDLRIGMTTASLRTACSIIRDTTRLASEGQMARMIAVAFPGGPVEAEIVDGKVWRVEVMSSQLRTADALGVGTPLSRLLSLRTPRGLTGEGQLFVVSPEHCGLSFRLSDNGSSARSQNWDRAALSRLPSATVVDKVLIVGCNQT